MHKLRIGVIMGGKSLEKEVSLNSGRTVCDYLDGARYTVVPLFQTEDNRLYILPQRFLYRGKISDFEHRLASEAQELFWDDLKEQVDLVYNAQHGRFGEDGCLQGVLEVLKIPYCGSKVFASALGMNKIMQKKILRANNIHVARGFELSVAQLTTITQDELAQKTTDLNLNFPLVVKPEQEGSSFGVHIVHNLEALVPAMQAASAVYAAKKQGVLVEEYLVGMEFSCIVITDYEQNKLLALPPTEIVSQAGYYDYEQKYMPGKSIKYTPARCSAENIARIKATCITVMQLLRMQNLSRIDGFLLPNGNVVITDPNSFAGMAPSSFSFIQAAQEQMGHTDFVNHLIETELHAYGIEHSMNIETIDIKTAAKKRIVVLLGGASNEKEISLESGRNVLYKLSPHTYDVIPLFVSSEQKLYKISHKLLVLNSTRAIEEQLSADMHINWHELPKIADFVFIALHGGTGENGSVQGMLEMLGLPYNGSGVLASSLCMDKFKTNQYLRSQGFDVPQHMVYSKEEWLAQVAPQLNFDFPVIIKPHDDGCSVLVSKAHNQTELQTQLAAFFATDKTVALIEEYITGMELTVGVVGNNNPQALPASKAVANAGILSIEEKFLPGAGENQTPAPITAEQAQLVAHTMQEVYKAVGCKGYARIDCFLQPASLNKKNKDRVIILEINTLPGLTPATCIFHQAAEIGTRPMEFIDLIINLGFEEHGQAKVIVSSDQTIETETIL